MSKIIRRLLPLAALLLVQTGSLCAQPADRPSIMNLGDAVMTGFSGTIIAEPKTPRPPNKSAIDFTFINPDGPAARVVNIGRPGYPWDGRLLTAPKTFNVFAKDSGQVFGVALDDQAAPNIYLAATSAFGLQLVGRGRDGLPERRKIGGPGVGWMKGQFGLDLQGDPGSIYKVDGRTGVVSLFAKVMLGGVPNPGPALGNLAYDAAHKQLFVSDLYTGMIHRFAVADGSEPGPPYDHGTTGRSAANLAPVPFDPANRPNIASGQFNSEDPATWGYAPPERRVWGLAVQGDRLFYSARNGAAAEGPQIWSVGIQPDGSLAADARLELEVAAQPAPYPVSDIAFSRQGAMILAQRAPVAASYDYSAFTQPAEPRVLRYWLKDPNDPPSPGLWKPVPDEYAIGFADQYRNTNGGVALGYGYDKDGIRSTGACEAALWTTGQNLRNNPALRSQLEPGGPLVVHGLQGNPADLVRPANEPPTTSYFVDYDDKFNDPAATGHLGSVRILAQPCVPGNGPPGNGPPGGDIIITPPGCTGPNCQPQICTPTCICPPGTVLEGKECVRRERILACNPPMVPNSTDSACVCPTGTVQQGNTCVPTTTTCQPPMVQVPGGPCACPTGTVQQGDTCVPTTTCQPPLVPGAVPGTCVCPPGTVPQGRKCVPQVCPPPLVPGPCCPEGTTEQNGECVPDGKVGEVIVEKKVKNDTRASTAVINALSFQIKLVCPPSPINTTFVLQNGGTHTENNVPYGSVCTVTETGLPPPPPNVCGEGSTAVWLTPVITVTPSATIGAPVTVFTVLNELTCVKIGQLSVTKTVRPDPRGIANTLSFPITLHCTNPTGTYFVTVNGNTSSVLINVPVGSICTVTEIQPALPAGCTWLPPVTTSVTIHAGLNQTMVTNAYRCTECPPPQVMNAAGACVCPPPLVSIPGAICGCPPPLVPGATPNTCVCPNGGTLVDGKCVPKTVCDPPLVMIPGAGCGCPNGEVLVGKECVKQDTCPSGTVRKGRDCVRPIICRAPLIPNAAGTACVCAAGLQQRGRSCVQPITCRAPATPNKAGTGCTCPGNMLPQGNGCIERPRDPKLHVPERIPGIGIPNTTPRGNPEGPIRR